MKKPKMKKRNKKNEDWMVATSRTRGFSIPFLLFFVGLFFIAKSDKNVDDSFFKAKGEIVCISKDSTEMLIQGEEKSFTINKFIDKSKVHIGDYAEIWYEEAHNGFNGGYSHLSYNFNSIKQLKINGQMIYEFSWWNNNKIIVLFTIIGAILIPIVVKERNEIVCKGEFDPAGPIVRTLVKVYPEDDDNEPTDIDYKEHSSIINEDNLVYDSDMDYSVYKNETSEIISVVFSDENGAYCRYFEIPDTEKEKDYSQLADLANNIRNNAEKYAEIDVSV